MELIKSSTQTMSSREIAKATGKRHDNLMAAIEKMEPAWLNQTGLSFKVSEYKDRSGKKNKEYVLDREQCLYVATKFNDDARAALVLRWKALEEKEQAKAIAAQSRQAARLEAPFLTDAVKLAHEEPKHYHYSNEFNLINRIVLGMTSKKYREEHEMSKADAIRDHLTPCEITAIEHMQRANTTMIEIGLDYEERKNKLSKLFIQKHQRKLLAEFKRLEY